MSLVWSYIRGEDADDRTNKWFGESNKLVAGLFSLARKVQPSIVSLSRIREDQG